MKKNLFLFNAYDNKLLQDFHFYRESGGEKVPERKYRHVIQELKKRRPEDYHITLYCQQVDPETYEAIGEEIIIGEYKHDNDII